MYQNFNRVLVSVYRACYVLLVIKFTKMLYHRIFPKMDYDYANAKMYIMAYYPKDGQGLLVFKSTAVCPEMLEWFKDVRDRMQKLIINGKVKIVTEDVPFGEIQLHTSADVVMARVCKDCRNTEALANLLRTSSITYTRIQEKHAAGT